MDTPRILLAALLAAVAACGEPPTDVVLVTMDTTRQDVLGVYGGAARTPALARLAADGVVLTRAYSVAFGTLPSHASLFTSSPALRHGVYDNETVLGEDHETLAEVLRGAGYETAAFVGVVLLGRGLGFDQGFAHYDDAISDAEGDDGLGRYALHERRARVTVTRFLDWLDGAREPFFVWLHFYDPHQPYAPLGREAADARAASFFETPEGEPKYAKWDLAELDPEELRRVEKEGQERYRGEVEFLDAHLRRIFDALEARGLYDRSLIVVVADHGENIELERGGELLFDHGGLFAGVSRLPLILKLPGARYAGSRRGFLAGNLDVAPTILDVLGLPAPPSWSGRSFLPALASEEEEFRPYLVLEGAHRSEIAVRTQRLFYREVPDRGAEVYDLEADPRELEVADRPRAARELHALVEDFLASGEPGAAERVASPERLEALRALGYVQ